MVKSNNSSYKIWLPLLIGLFTALGMLVGYRLAYERAGHDLAFVKSFEDNNGQIGRIEELIRLIDARYVDKVDQDELLDAATNAIVDKLDPHSVYIPKERLAEIKQTMSGYYEGIGIETVLIDDTLRITNVLDESPAKISGLKYGDRIIAVEDSIIAGVNMTVQDQWDLLKINNSLNLQIEVIHANNSKELINIVPAKIKFPNVEYFTTESGLNYVNIHKFSDDTYEGLVVALEKFQENLVIDNLVIDLRNNPGGYLPEATKILNQLFVEDKRLLVYTQDKSERKNEYNTTGRPFYKIEKLAVLINENSASASEIIAGAVQDWDKAIIIGEQSFGKGLVQEQYELDNGGALRLTIARYYTPTGRYIQTPYKNDINLDSTNYQTKILNRPLIAQGGITPDIKIEWTNTEKQLRNDLAVRRVALAYEFILDNNLLSQHEVELNVYEEELNQIIQDSIYKDLTFADTALLKSMRSVLEIEIYQQLNNTKKANEILASSDLYILTAQKAISEKDIFAILEN